MEQEGPSFQAPIEPLDNWVLVRPLQPQSDDWLLHHGLILAVGPDVRGPRLMRPEGLFPALRPGRVALYQQTCVVEVGTEDYHLVRAPDILALEAVPPVAPPVQEVTS